MVLYIPNSKPETIENFVEDIQNAESEIKDVLNNPDFDINHMDDVKPITVNEDKRLENNDVDKKWNELIRLSEDGDIDQSVKYLKKASAKVINKLYQDFESKRLEKANSFLTDMLISKFASVLGGLDAIASEEELNSDLQKDKLLKRDVESLVSTVTPFIPFFRDFQRWGHD